MAPQGRLIGLRKCAGHPFKHPRTIVSALTSIAGTNSEPFQPSQPAADLDRLRLSATAGARTSNSVHRPNRFPLISSMCQSKFIQPKNPSARHSVPSSVQSVQPNVGSGQSAIVPPKSPKVMHRAMALTHI